MSWTLLSRRLLVALLILGSGQATRAQAQGPAEADKPDPMATRPAQPGVCTTISGFPFQHVPAPLTKPRPAEGAQSVGAALAGISETDVAVEVILNQARIITFKDPLQQAGKPNPVIAVGNGLILDYLIVGPRQIRINGQRIGITDLSVTTADLQTYVFQVQVVYDLNLLRCRLKALFPDASIKLAQINNKVVVEGEARDHIQVNQIISALTQMILGLNLTQQQQQAGQPGAPREGQPAQPSQAATTQTPAGLTDPEIINLLRVPGPQQVLLKVRIAELNRTGMREIGADFLFVDPDTGTVIGTQIGGAAVAARGAVVSPGSGLVIDPTTGTSISPNSTVFGIFDQANFEFVLRALRRNTLLKILAEPNLVALSGHQATFLAGGSFPVPVPQVGAGGVSPTITVQFQPFGVTLSFVPFILDGGDTIRLSVDPEVSSVDFSLGTVLVVGGTPVPGLNIRRAHTTVEMKPGQTLAIAGLMQLTLDAQTSRIPGIGDLPIIGPFFSNTTGMRQEKELVVLVTPYLVEPMNCDQVPPSPGDEVKAPDDLEFYLLGRIEGRTGVDWRITTNWDDPLHVLRHFFRVQTSHVCGPHGFTD